ncbi:hypothetical protein HDU77_009028 [Chytriomyces hyalinus]|nr:hypothetical protein HDU77_009028 [Chytriomyces hyalinus]
MARDITFSNDGNSSVLEHGTVATPLLSGKDTDCILVRVHSAGVKISSKSKLRSSEDVFNRIVWDNRLTQTPRKADQQGEDWIPFHRVWYFKRVVVNVQIGESVVDFVWDRKSKSDCIFT